MNPYFKVEPPLSDSTRNSIFSLFSSDPEKHTPRSLATSYGISIARVTAIIRLKALEAKNRMDGVPVQDALASNMDALLLARSIEKDDISGQPVEPLRPKETRNQKTFFAMVNETGIRV